MYVCNGQVFATLDEACAYAEFIHRETGVFVAIELAPQETSHGQSTDQ
jgi:hypothetical protein